MSSHLPSDVAQAHIVAGDVSTHYFSAGRGEPIVILTGDTHVRACLLGILPRRFRLIAPEPAPQSQLGGVAAAAAWFCTVLDALGVECVTLIADEEYAATAVQIADLDPDRVNRLVLLQQGAREGGNYLVSSAEEPCEPPLFVAWLGAGGNSGLYRILRPVLEFIDGALSSAPP